MKLFKPERINIHSALEPSTENIPFVKRTRDMARTDVSVGKEKSPDDYPDLE